MYARAYDTGLSEPGHIQDWLERHRLTAQQNDCVTAIVLKVLDEKCKMPAEKQAAIIAIYAQTRKGPGALFHPELHRLIEQVIRSRDKHSLQEIHVFRQLAEASIPKPVMKTFKTFLAETLFADID
jgi:hypothetical protein